MRNCSAHLGETIAIVRPGYVVALGRVAPARCGPSLHGAVLARDVGRRLAWDGRWLVPLYHPGPRARVHRAGPLQAEDFRRLGAMIRGGKMR